MATYTYDAFGNTTSSGAAAQLNVYRFSTKEQIGGLYYYGYRFYAPGLGKWINRDPIQEAGGINIYAFVGNNPLSAHDAYGEGIIAAGIGGILGAAVGYYFNGKIGAIAGAIAGIIGGATLDPYLVSITANVVQTIILDYLKQNKCHSMSATEWIVDIATAVVMGIANGVAGAGVASVIPKEAERGLISAVGTYLNAGMQNLGDFIGGTDTKATHGPIWGGV